MESLIKQLEENYVSIKEEFDAHNKNDQEIFTNGRSSGEWTSAGLKSVWGHWNKDVPEQYPTLFKIFEPYPFIKAVSINCLGPKSYIGMHHGRIYQNVMYKRYLADKEHWAIQCREEDKHIKPVRGKYLAYRFHYGLQVPDVPLLLGLESENKIHRWENGKTFMFKDFEMHRAWNDSEEKRYALIFDVLEDDYTALSSAG